MGSIASFLARSPDVRLSPDSGGIADIERAVWCVRGNRTIPYFLAGLPPRLQCSGLPCSARRIIELRCQAFPAFTRRSAGFVYARRRASSLRNDLSNLTLKVLPSSVNTRAERKRERNRLKTELPTRSVSAYS